MGVNLLTPCLRHCSLKFFSSHTLQNPYHIFIFLVRIIDIAGHILRWTRRVIYATVNSSFLPEKASFNWKLHLWNECTAKIITDFNWKILYKWKYTYFPKTSSIKYDISEAVIYHDPSPRPLKVWKSLFIPYKTVEK